MRLPCLVATLEAGALSTRVKRALYMGRFLASNAEAQKSVSEDSPSVYCSLPAR